MPFTFSHIAAVLPGAGKTPVPLSMSALVIGSMVPDFEYFFRMTLYGHYGHTFSGILLFDLPAGIVSFIAYHWLIRDPLLRHLPVFLYRRLYHGTQFRWRQYLWRKQGWFLLSLIIGLLTHLLWDAFTHDEEYVLARYVPLLLYQVQIGTRQIPVHFILQLISSLAGMVIVVVYVLRLPVRPTPKPLPESAIRRYWIVVSLITIMAITVRWTIGVPNEKLVGQAIVVAISAWFLALLLVSSGYKIINKYAHDT